MSMYATRLVPHHVATCARCATAHDYILEIRSTSRTRSLPKVVLFGGESGSAPPRAAGIQAGAAADDWEIVLTCPTTGEAYVELVSPRPIPSEDVVGIVPHEEVQEPAGETLRRELAETELTEWVKASAATVRDFSKTMITVSTGAIPVFFAVMKYLGEETASAASPVWLGVLPPVLFLLATLLFIVSLRPQYIAAWGVADFEVARSRRLRKMNRWIRVAVALFALGVGSSITVFALLSWARVATP